jgi:hypothetical protein
VLSVKNRFEQVPCRGGIVRGHKIHQIRPLFLRSDLAVTDVQPHPRGIGDIFLTLAGTRSVEVDESEWHSIPEHAVARTWVPVKDDLAFASQLTVHRGIVEQPQEPRRSNPLLLLEPADPARRGSGDVREDCATLLIGAEETRGTIEPSPLQMSQNVMHEGRFFPHRAPHGVAHADYARCREAAPQCDLLACQAVEEVAQAQGHLLERRWHRFWSRSIDRLSCLRDQVVLDR